MQHPNSKCGNYGHWRNPHNTEGSLPAGTKSVDSSNTLNNKERHAAKTTLKYNMVRTWGCLTDARKSQTTDVSSSLVDGKGPYSAMGIIKIQFLEKQIWLSVSGSLIPIAFARSVCLN